MTRYLLFIGAVILTFDTLTRAQALFPGNLNPCRKGICQNGGTCIAPIDYPQCVCAPGFYGALCEFSRDPCFNFTCLNGGQCTAPADFPYCECRPGYTGDKCQTRIGGEKDGQCPIVRRGSVGTCGGATCSVECSVGQKCCQTACGRKRCTKINMSEAVDLVSLCSLIDCAPDRYCRATLACDTCVPVATCVPLSNVGGGIDQECRSQNYLQVLLIQSAYLPETYNRLRCRGPSSRDCPKGSVCFDDLRGGGVCCFGKLVVEKPGTCPTKQQVGQVECVGTLCETDDQCPNTQKCCGSTCGYDFCTDVLTDQPYCPGGCPKGYFCEFRPVPCPPGLLCIQIVIPTCVPLIPDRCGGCPELQVCVMSDEPCLGFNCPNFVCVPNDECGGCLPGQRCETYDRVCPPPPPCDGLDGPPCLTVLCDPIRRCVPIETTPAPTDPCRGCPTGQECQFVMPPCPPPPGCDQPDLTNCTRPFCVPVPLCVPSVTTSQIPTDPCGGCQSGEKCQYVMPPCPPPRECDQPDLSGCNRPFCVSVPRCIPDITTTPIPQVDECGGCRTGQICRQTGIVCKNAPCPSFACFDTDD